MHRSGRAVVILAGLFLLAPRAPLTAQHPSPGLYGELKWRSIGPYRGGRTKAATGVP